MAARGKLKDRNWRRGNGDPATIDDITVLVIPILSYKQEQEGTKEDEDEEKQNDGVKQVVVEVVGGNKLDEGLEAMEVEKEGVVKGNHTDDANELASDGFGVDIE